MFLVNLIIIQAIIFTVVIYSLKKLLYGDTENAVSRLDKALAEANKKKKELADKMEHLEEEYKKKKEEAESLSLQLKEEAEKEINEKRDKTVKQAREESEKIITDAKNAKEKLREQIQKEESEKIYQKSAELLKDFLSQHVKGSLNAILINEFVDDMGKAESRHIPDDLQEVELTLSDELDSGTKEKLIGAIKSKVNRDITINEKIDAAILGGAIVKFETLVLDGSLANKINDSLAAKMV